MLCSTKFSFPLSSAGKHWEFCPCNHRLRPEATRHLWGQRSVRECQPHSGPVHAHRSGWNGENTDTQERFTMDTFNKGRNNLQTGPSPNVWPENSLGRLRIQGLMVETLHELNHPTRKPMMSQKNQTARLNLTRCFWKCEASTTVQVSVFLQTNTNGDTDNEHGYTL